MMNRYSRGAIAALAIAALCSPLYVGLPGATMALAAEAAGGGSTTAMVVPAAQQIDAFGYAGTSPAAISDTGFLVASSLTGGHLGESIPDLSIIPGAAAPAPAEVSWMPSVRALRLMSPSDLQEKSLKSLYQLER